MQHSNSPLHSRALPLLALLFATALTLPAFAQKAFVQPTSTAASVPDRITQPINEAQLVTLQRNTRPEANSRNDRGAVSDGFDIEHMLLLLQRSPERERELDKLIDELNDRTSPNFHHWLTADEFGQRFGVAPEDIDTITNWLKSHGFRVNRVYPSRILIDFSGAAGQLREAFHTEIHQLEVNGEPHISNMSDPRIPAALVPVVKGIFSLNDFKPHPMYKPAPQYTFAGCASSADVPTEPGTCYAITPQDNQTIYNLNPLYSAGISGQGQTIVLVEDTDTYNGTGDWNTYRSTFGLASAFPEGTYTQVHPGGCTDPGTNGDDGEAAIDVEVASAIAPSAAIELISCASGTVTFGGLIALQNLINESGTPPAIVSVSYGVCEAFNGNGGNAAFYNTYQQAASEGVSVFGASGDEGPSSCSADFSIGSEYDVASLGVSGWTDTPYNVAVGGTDFEDVYNSKEGGAPLSTFWSATNSASYGSALQYIPEIPWNDSCASVLISEVANGTFTTYGSSGTCNKSPYDTTSGYLIAAAGSGGASNCATGNGGTNQGDYGISDPQCQGWAKPSWQSGSSLTGGKAVYGQPSDGVRDIPDVSMFAANGIWGHYEVVCWSDPAYTSDGAASCSGAPSTWSGFGGTSVASPTMAAIQALVNQKTGESWGNPNPIYYQIAQKEYGTAGGSFLGSSCNSSGSGGPGSGCVFNDVTQGDIDLACEDNGTTEEAHCYKPSGTRGVDSTDVITAATVINGGSGYTTAPTCTIAGPTNVSPYLSPTGTTLWAGGTQATCTATVNSGTTTAKWTVAIESTDAVGDQIIVGPDTYTLTGSNTTTIASNLAVAINSPANPVATATVSSSTVTITATTAGAAGNFTVSFGTATLFNAFYVFITDTTLGEGPNYVSGITITAGGSGYQPETPITLTGGGGTDAIAVANTSFGTAASAYQPAYGAAPGYDLATGLGSVNATNLVNSSAWLPSEPPGIYSPTPGSTLTGYSATFQWGAKPGATAYWLDVGSPADGNIYYSSGSLPTTTLSVTVDSLPTNGSIVYVTLYWLISGSWVSNQYTYTAFGGSADRGAITSPTPGSTLGGSSVTFTWSAGAGATQYWLDVGSTLGGQQYTTGNLGDVLTKTVNGLPTNGSTIYVTLYSLVSGTWLSNAYTYTAAAGGVLTTPPPGTTLTGSTVTFDWTAGSGTSYWLDVGSTAGGQQFTTGNLGDVLTKTVSGLPTNGSTIYVTLYSLVSGTWLSNAYTYTALNANAGLAVIQTPAPGSTLSGNVVTFTWSADANATQYWLDVGSTPAGQQYATGNLGNVLSTTVYSLPANGSTIYTTLYSYVGGQWLSTTATYVSGPFTTSSNCASPVAIGPYTVCNSAAKSNGGAASTISATISPSAGNGVEIFGFICADSVNSSGDCNGSPTQTAIVSDNLNNPETCFTAAPHSPYLSDDTTVPDIIKLFAWYCPSIPAGITSFTLTFSGAGYYPEIDVTEYKAGSIASSNFFENVDTVNFGTTGSTATITTSGPTANANDLITAMLDNCGGSVNSTVGTGYTGILVNTPEPGHIVEAMSTTTTGTKSATMTWSSEAPRSCGGGTGGNDSWFGIIVPLIGAVPTASLSPTSLTFSSLTAGSANATQVITLSNTGETALTIASGGITGMWDQRRLGNSTRQGIWAMC